MTADTQPSAGTLTVVRLSDSTRPLWGDVHAMHVLVGSMVQQAAGDVPRVLWSHPVPGHVILRTAREIDPARVPGVVTGTGGHLVPGNGLVRLTGIVNAARTKCRRQERVRVASWRIPVPQGDVAAWIAERLPLTAPVVTTRALSPGRGVKGTRRIFHARTVFTAIGNLSNRDGLEQVMRCGLGKERAYGCGLVMAVSVDE